MDKRILKYQNIIGLRLFRQSLFIALVMTVVLTFIQVWLNYQQLQGVKNSSFEQVKQVQMEALSTALWNYSMPELKSQTAGIINYPYISYAEVRDTQNVIITNGNKLTENFTDATIPIEHLLNGKVDLIGYLYIQADNQELVKTIYADLIQIFAFSAINVIILTLIFMVLIDRQVTRHLHTAAEYFRNFETKQIASRLKLNKKTNGDELDSLVSAFNRMQTNLATANNLQSESERKYATLLSNLPGMAYRCKNDRNYTMELVSAGCVDLTGYKPEEIINNERLSYNDLIIPEDREVVWETVQQQLQESLAFEITYRIKSRFEQIRWVWERGIGVYSLEGELEAIEGFITDITERKQQEQELEAIAEVSYALRTAETRNDVLKLVLDRTMKMLDASGGSIEMIEPSSGDAVVEIAAGAYEHLLGRHYQKGDGLNSYIYETRKPYLNNDVFNDPRNLTQEIDQNCRAASGVPMFAHDQLLGFIWFGRDQEISQRIVSTLSAIADISANAIYRVSLFHQKEQQVNQLTGLRKIDTAINSNYELNHILNILIEQCVDLLHVNSACVFSFDSNIQIINQIACYGQNPHAQQEGQRVSESGLIGKSILERDIVKVFDIENQDFPEEQKARFVNAGLKSCFISPLIAKDEILGVLEVCFEKSMIPDNDWMDYLETLAGQAAIAISDSNLVRNLKQSNFELELAYDATLEGWSNALDLRDKETEKHTERVTEITLQIAKSLGIYGEDIRNIWRGARLHDIGKMGVPDGILLKPGKLTPDEWNIMKKHPENAYRLLYPIKFLRQALDIPYCHHEKWDGSGYPRGLKGEEIPLAARIFAIVDVWDAMTQDRVYRKALSEDETLKYISENAGTHFDPNLVELFLYHIKQNDFNI